MEKISETKQVSKKRWYGCSGSILDVDEQNSIEFPLALLSRSVPVAQKEIVFRDRIRDNATGLWLDRSCTVSANANSSLPNWWDQDVFLALEVLTNRKNGWQNPVVEFTIYEILKLMNLLPTTKNIRRVAKALDNWQGVRVKYSHWRVGDTWTHPKAFGFIQDYDLTRRGRRLPDQPQVFTWSRIFFESFQQSNGKEFDSDFYFSLRLPTTRRMFRFLDKRLRNRATYDYSLIPFCTEKIGMSRGYKKPSKYKEKILPACKELVERGFLANFSDERRFSNGRIWFARGRRQASQESSEKRNQTGLCKTSKVLCSCGVSVKAAIKLVQSFSKDQIEYQVEHLDWLTLIGKGPKNSGAWLAKAISESYQAPEGFVSKPDRMKARKLIESQNNAHEKRKAEAEQEIDAKITRDV